MRRKAKLTKKLPKIKIKIAAGDTDDDDNFEEAEEENDGEENIEVNRNLRVGDEVTLCSQKLVGQGMGYLRGDGMARDHFGLYCVDGFLSDTACVWRIVYARQYEAHNEWDTATEELKKKRESKMFTDAALKNDVQAESVLREHKDKEIRANNERNRESMGTEVLYGDVVCL